MSRELAVIDEAPIRKKYVQKCRRKLQDLERARKEWELFEKSDQPAYQRWYNEHFGAAANELRELQETSFEMLQTIESISYFRFREGLSPHEAYERVMDMRRNPEKYRVEFDDDWDDPFCGAHFDDDEFDDDDDDDEYDDEYDEVFDAKDFSEAELKAFFETILSMDLKLRKACKDPGTYQEYFRRFKATFASNGECFDFSFDEDEDEYDDLQKEDMGRIKSRYRVLARRLHPDYCKSQDPRLQELWHDAQIAYQERNLERLDMIFALYNLYEDNLGGDCSVSQIQAAESECSDRLGTLRGQLRKVRKDVVWGFSKLQDRSKLEKSIRQELDINLRRARMNLEEYRSLLDQWSKPPAPRAGKNDAAATDARKNGAAAKGAGKNGAAAGARKNGAAADARKNGAAAGVGKNGAAATDARKNGAAATGAGKNGAAATGAGKNGAAATHARKKSSRAPSEEQMDFVF